MKKLRAWLTLPLSALLLIGNAQTKTLNPLKGFHNPFTSSAKPATVNMLGKMSSTNEPDTFKISAEGESFFSNVRKYGESKNVFEQNIKSHLGLNRDFSFRLINSKTDDLGFTHVRYDQYYKGYRIDA